MVVGSDSDKGLTLQNASASRTTPSAEAVTAPRPREQSDPPSPPDRRPSRRGGHPSPYIYAVSAAGRPAGFARVCVARRGLVRSARALAAAVLLVLSGALAVPAQAQTTCTTNTGDLWCGVVTVASVTGFVPGDGFSGSEGNLSETGFTYGTNSYTITRVFIAEGGSTTGNFSSV